MKKQTMRPNVFPRVTANFSFLLALSLGLAIFASVPVERGAYSLIWHRQASRGLAALAFSQDAFSSGDSFNNAARVLNPGLFQTLLSVNSQVQSQMQAGIPAGTPVWSGQGPLPGAVGTGSFNPTFSFDYSGCSIVPMNFYDVYSPSVNLPTVWCGAVAQGQTKASAPLASNTDLGSNSGSAPVSLNGDGMSNDTTPMRAMQLQ